jgi:excisionase family DNA binding protein
MLLTTAEAAAKIGVSVPTVTRLAREGRLTPVRKLDGNRGAYLFEAAEVERYARQALTDGEVA